MPFIFLFAWMGKTVALMLDIFSAGELLLFFIPDSANSYIVDGFAVLGFIW